MKKKVAAVIAAVASLACVGALAACNEPEDHNCISSTYVLKTTITEPTCTDPGWGLFVCPVPKCGNSTEKEIGVTPHDYILNADSSGYACSVCKTPAPDGYDPNDPPNEKPEQPKPPVVDPSLVDSDVFTFVTLSESGTLSWSRLKAASKYVLSVTHSGETEPITHEIDKSKGSVDLGTLNLTAGKTAVKLSAYTIEKVEIDGKEYEQEVPMDNAVDEFRVVKLNGEYSLVRLKYSDDYVTLNGFYSDAREGSDGSYYLYELPLVDNKATQFNVSNHVKPATGYSVSYYTSKSDRASGRNAISSMDMKFQYVTDVVTYYVRVKSGSEIHDYTLRIEGLRTLEIRRYNLKIDYDENNYRIETPELVGSTLHRTALDIIPAETLFSGIDSSDIGRDARYNAIERADYVVTAPAVGNTLELYFYNRTKVENDCKTYKQYSAAYNLFETTAGWSLSSSYEKGGDTMILPATINEKKVVYASFDYATVETLYVLEGATEFVARFIDCTHLRDIYLPSTITNVGARAFGGINDEAVIHCAFSEGVASGFEDFWNYKVGGFNAYETEYETLPEVKSNGLKFELGSDYATVTGIFSVGEFNGKIPENVAIGTLEYPVNRIAALGELESVEIGANIEIIESGALSDVGRVTVASGNTVFAETDGVIYKNGTEIIFVAADVTEVVLPTGLQSIADGAFDKCTALTKVTVESDVTGLDENTFANCEITDVECPTGCLMYFDITVVKNVVFTSGDEIPDNFIHDLPSYKYQRTALETVVLPDTLKTIGSYAFNECASLKEIEIPNGVTTIGDGAFCSCSSLNEIVIPDSVTTMGSLALSYCSSLESLTLPFIGEDGTESGAKALSWLLDSSVAPKYVTVTGGYIVEDAFRNTNMYGGSSSIDNLLKVTLDVESIATNAFYGCGSLEEVTIGEHVGFIGYNAFRSCSAITKINYYAVNCQTSPNATSVFDGAKVTSVVIGDKVESIPDGLFGGCLKMDTLTIPASVKYIGSSAFESAEFTSFVIPDTVELIGEYVFAYCTKLESLTVPFVGAADTVEGDAYQMPFGYLFGRYSYTGAVKTEQTYIHDPNSSYGATNRVTHYIPESLKNVTVTGGRLVYGAFMNCGMIENITFRGSMNKIEPYAFYQCVGISSLDIPKGLTYIGEYAFGRCENLTLNYAGTKDEWNSYSIYKHTYWNGNATGLKIVCSDGEIQ